MPKESGSLLLRTGIQSQMIKQDIYTGENMFKDILHVLDKDKDIVGTTL